MNCVETVKAGSERDFLTVSVIAARMGVSRSRVYQLAAAKEIPTVMVGGRILIPRTAWEEWLRRKTAEAWTENTEANNG